MDTIYRKVELDFENDIKINPMALEIECSLLPNCVYKYTQECANMEKRMDSAKDYLEMIKAETDHSIRSNPKKYIPDLEKSPTEAMVQSAVLQSKRVKEAQQAYLEAKHEYRIHKGAVDALNKKGEQLGNLIMLLRMDYFSGPKVPRDLEAEYYKRVENNKKIAKERVKEHIMEKGGMHVRKSERRKK
jgi:hypothetical protein